jgi:hypothetical protein
VTMTMTERAGSVRTAAETTVAVHATAAQANTTEAGMAHQALQAMEALQPATTAAALLMAAVAARMAEVPATDSPT